MTYRYADVHYYFTEPSPRPASHRMDKGSYVYLYRGSNPKRGRLEVANYAGTEDQDAFTGYLDDSMISNKYKHPGLVTIVVDGVKPSNPHGQESEHHWRLPSTDPRDEGKYLFRLHTLDIYFWTVDDARTFINHAHQTLRPEQLEVDLPPPPVHRTEMSPVVQQLENVAITDPAYKNGKTRNSRTDSNASPQLQLEEKDKQPKEEANYTPLAYNPAAPAAPEKRAHREKTPPPPDTEHDTSPAAAVHSEYQPAQPHAPYTPGLGSPSPFSAHSGVASPSQQHPVSPGSTHSGYKPPPGDPNAHLYTPAPSTTAVASATPGTPNAPGYVDSPTTQILGSSYVGGRPTPLQHVQPQYADYLGARPQPPPGSSGYAPHAYNPAAQAQHGAQHGYGAGTGDHALHSSVYRPSEEDIAHGKPPKRTSTGAEGAQGKYDLEGKAERAEKKFNKFLRKVEKKIG